MASSRPWPFEDQDRPNGSVRPLSKADLQAILAHLASDDPDELLASTGADRPVVALRVRASVGRPGGSAHARWRRSLAAEWAAWTRTLPWRIAVTLGIGVGGGVLSRLLVPRLSLSKLYRGRLQLDPSGQLWHGRYHLAPSLRAVSFEADQAALVLADPTWWWSRSWSSMAPRSPGARWSSRACRWWRPGLPSMLRQLPAVLGPEGVAVLADQARAHFHAAA